MAEQNPAWLKRLNIGIYEGSLAGHYIRIQRIEDAKAGEPQWNLYIKKGADKFITDKDWDNDYWTKAQAVEYVEKKMRTQNGEHHADHRARQEGADPFPWGFFKSSTQDRSGLKEDRRVHDHDALAEKMGYRDEEAALHDGWIRYLYIHQDDGWEVVLNWRVSPNLQAQCRSILGWLTKQEIEPDWMTLEAFHAESGYGPDDENYLDVAVNSTLGKQMLRALAAGKSLPDVQKMEKRKVRNPTHWMFKGQPSSSIAWGFVSPTGKTLEGQTVRDSAISTHSKLAVHLGLVPDDPNTIADQEALKLGYLQYMIYRNATIGGEPVPGGGVVDLELTAWGNQANNAKRVHKWLTTGYGAKFPVETGVLDFYNRDSGHIVVEGGTFKELVAGALAASKGLLKRERNGLHHLDSPSKRPEGWDDFTGWPWGFIKGTRDESGLDDSDQVDNHDTLAYRMGYKQGEDDALDNGWVRYLFTYNKASEQYSTEKTIDNPIWLNLSMIAPFPAKAKSVLHFVKQGWDLDPDYITCYFRPDPDDMEGRSYDISGSRVQMKGVFERIARGEDPAFVKRDLGIKNPAYAHDNQARQWGWITPTGKIIDGNTAKVVIQGRATHRDLIGKVEGIHSDTAFDKGYVRFAVLRDGSSLFTISGLTEALTLKALKNAAHFIHTSPVVPVVSGEVQFDLFLDWATPIQAYTATFDQEEHAYTVLSLMASGKRWPTGKERIWQSLDGGRKSPMLEGRFQYARERESNPTYLGRHHPFKLHGPTTTGPLTAEFHDHTKYLITKSPVTGLWAWKLPQTGERGEPRDRLESVLVDLDLREKQHTGRLGGAMKFVVFSQAGVAVGTVSAPDRDAAITKLSPVVAKFGVTTTQRLYLYPYLSANTEIRYAADRGVQV